MPGRRRRGADYKAELHGEESNRLFFVHTNPKR